MDSTTATVFVSNHHHSQQQQQQRTKNTSSGKRTSTREKIEKMVADGTTNYPAYLKLIYTGDSEEPSSSEDELSVGGDAGRYRTAAAAGTRYQRPVVGSGVQRPAAVVESRDWNTVNSCSLTGNNALKDSRCAQNLSAAATATDSEHEHHQRGDDGVYDDVYADDVINSRLAVSQSEKREQDEDFEERHNRASLGGATQQQQQQQCSAEDETALRHELNKLQDDIATLKSVLNSKVSEATSLRQKLGLTTMAEIKHDLQNGIKTIKLSGTFQKTNAAIKSLSAYAYRKLGNIRQSVAFQSVEDKVGSLRTSRSMGSIRSKFTSLSTSRSENNVAAAAAGAAATHTITDDDDEDYDYQQQQQQQQQDDQ